MRILPKDPLLLTLGALALLANAISWGILLWKVPSTEETVFLHYNIYFGIDLAGEWKQIFWIPGSGLVVWAVNSLFTLWSQSIDRLVKIIFLLTTLLFEIMLIVASIFIVLLNTD